MSEEEVQAGVDVTPPTEAAPEVAAPATEESGEQTAPEAAPEV